MFSNITCKKRKFNCAYEKNISKIKKTKKQKNNEDEDGEDSGEDGDSPIILPNLFGQEHDDELIYLKQNHLYYHTEVSENSVDRVKKLMREYWNKTKNISNKHTCITFTPKPLYLHIFSPGGCVYSGLSLYDFINEYKKKIPVITVVEGMCASAATFFSVIGTKRYISPSGHMLIHQLSTMFGGNFEQVQDEYINSKKLMDKIMNIYNTHTKIDKKKLPNMLKHDLNFEASECIKYGLVDGIKFVDIFNDDIDENDESGF